MSERAATLAEQVEQLRQSILAGVAGFSEAQWRTICDSEQRPVNVLCHHIGEGYEFAGGLVQTVAAGQPLPAVTMDDINAGNAQHAQQHAACTKQEALDHLRRTGEGAVTALRDLSDEQLDRTGALFGRTMTAQQVAELLLLGHPRGHWQSIQQALGA